MPSLTGTSPSGTGLQAAERYRSSDPLLAAPEAAIETGRAISTFWRDVKIGLLPAPYYVTPRSPRWRLSELKATVAAAPRSNKQATTRLASTAPASISS